MGAFMLRGCSRRGRCDYRDGIHGHAGGKHWADGDIAALGPTSPVCSLGGDCLFCAFLLRCRTNMASLDGVRSACAGADLEFRHRTEPVFQRSHQPQAYRIFGWRDNRYPPGCTQPLVLYGSTQHVGAGRVCSGRVDNPVAPGN